MHQFGKPKAQPALPGLAPPPSPPRKKSVGEEWFDLFIAARAQRLEQLGDDPRIERDRPSPAAINTVTAQWVSYCGGDTERAADMVASYIGEFLRDPWAASLSPPFPWKALASEKVWRPRFERLAEEAAH